MFNSVHWTHQRFGIWAAIVVGGILVAVFIVHAVGFIDTIRDISDTENPHWARMIALAVIDWMPIIGPLANRIIGGAGIILLLVAIGLASFGSRITAKSETALLDKETGASVVHR